MANALIISKQTGGYFSFNLSINGAVQDEVRSIQNDLLTVGNTLHFKTSNGANIIKQQDITPAELTIIASGTFTFATVTQVWDKLIEVGFFDWLGTGGGAGVDRFDELLDTFQYFGKDGYVCIVNESQQKLEAVPFYNYRKFTDLEDSPSFLVPNKMVVVNPTGDALILQDQPATPDTYLNSVGYFDYNDSITHTTPLPFVFNTPKKLTNDTLGANTNTSENPYGVSFVWDSSVNQFNFSQLSVGDTVDIRIQIQVTTTSANQKFKVSAKFGIGSVAQFENTILSTQVKTAGLEEISFVAPFYIGSSYIRDFPAELYITSDAGGSVIVDGWYIRILRKNINIITIESSVPDATTLVKGIVRLGGDLSGTADNPTVPALATKIANTRLINTSAPLTGGGDLSADRTISIPQANTSTNGYLSGGDWTTFNNKQPALGGTGIVKSTSGVITYLTDNSTNWNTAYTSRIASLTTTGSSGASTFITNTLNIPNYTLAGLGGQPLNSNLTSVSSLTYVSPAFVKMTGLNTFTLDTNTYLTSTTGVSTLSGGTTGLTPNTATSGAITLGGTLVVANGGTGSTTASGARTNLGATTIGSNLFTATNPSAVTFLRTNADNTISWLDAVSFRTAIGAGTSTVTPSALTKVDDTNVTLTLGGTPATALLQGVSLTLGWTGTLADGRIASASTWNSKQAGSSNLTSLSGLTYASTSFVKMTGLNTFTLDTTSYQPLLTNPITGSLTTGYITKATGATTLGNSVIYDNAGNIGIGTASPTKKLHIKGENDNVLFLDNGGEQYTTQYFANNGVTKSFLGWDNTSSLFQIGTAVSSDLSILTANSEKMRITSGGNVLIGTTTDNGVDKLQVNGSGYFSGNLGIGASSSNEKLKVEDNSFNSTLRLNQTASTFNSTLLYGTVAATLGAFDFIGMYNNGVAKFNVSNNGSVTASSFVKSGGLSTQFLMADGSTTTSSGGSGANLTYTSSPTNGIVVSDTGTDATIPLADGTNAGLLSPSGFTNLSNAVLTTGNQTKAGILTFANTGSSKINGITLTNSSTSGASIDSTNSSTGTGISLSNSAAGFGIDSLNSGAGIGINSTNSTTGSAIKTTNNGGGNGIFSVNNSTGVGIFVSTTSSGTGVHIDGSSNATGLVLNSGSTGTGLLLSGRNNATQTSSITKDGDITCNDIYVVQPTPTAKTATATLTIAEILTNIITVTSTTAVTLTLPTGTLTDAGILAGTLATNGAFEWNIINLGSSSGAITMAAGTAHTYVGNATIAIGTSVTFRTRKTATNTFITYRI